ARTAPAPDHRRASVLPWSGTARPPRARRLCPNRTSNSFVHLDDGLHDEPEAAQHAEQFAVAEGLAPGRQPGPAGRLLEQRVGGVGLQQPGLLVVAVAVDDAVRAAERARRVYRVERG